MVTDYFEEKVDSKKASFKYDIWKLKRFRR